jgi:flagellar hook-associated protein 2
MGRTCQPREASATGSSTDCWRGALIPARARADNNRGGRCLAEDAMVGLIQFGGLASGLDTQAIIDALLGVQAVPKLQAEAQLEEQNQKLELIGTIEGYVKALRDKAQELSTAAGFLKKTSSISQEGVASISVTGAAAAGSHTLIVNSLASAARHTFDAVADPDADVGGGTISFTYGGTAYSVSIAAGESSLNEIAAKLNSEASAAVSASVVNVGTEAAPSYQLVIAGNDTGADFALVGLTSTTGLTGQVELTAASNAQIVVDGLTVVRSTNEFTGVLDGVTIQAEMADPTNTVTFTVNVDKEAIKAGLQEFVDAYNQVMNFVNQQNTFDPDVEAPLLIGDSALESVRREIRSALFDVDIAVVTADTLGYSTLGLVGIELQSDGTLSIDDTVLDEKLDGNLDAFEDLFRDLDGFDNGGAAEGTPEFYVDTTADSGLFESLYRAIDKLTEDQTIDLGGETTVLQGLFDARRDAINEVIDDLDERIADLERQLEESEEDLVKKFSDLEVLLGGLQSQQAALASLASLSLLKV